MEQETREDGLIRRALSSLFDPELTWAMRSRCGAQLQSALCEII